MSVIGALSGFFLGGLPANVFFGWFVGGAVLGPMSWWVISEGRKDNFGRSANIYY